MHAPTLALDGHVHLSVARYAKERKLRIWRDYVAPTANLDQKDKQFVAKVSALQARRCLVQALTT